MVIEVRLNLIHNLLGPRSSTVLRLCQLLHGRRVDGVGVAVPDPVCQVVVHRSACVAHSALLRVHDCLGLCLSLGLRDLQI